MPMDLGTPFVFFFFFLSQFHAKKHCAKRKSLVIGAIGSKSSPSCWLGEKIGETPLVNYTETSS